MLNLLTYVCAKRFCNDLDTEGAAPPEKDLAPGEFWHDPDAGLLYCVPAEGQTAAQLEDGAWIATEEALLTYNKTSSHSWVNVVFSHSTWMQPNSDDGVK